MQRKTKSSVTQKVPSGGNISVRPGVIVVVVVVVRIVAGSIY